MRKVPVRMMSALASFVALALLAAALAAPALAAPSQPTHVRIYHTRQWHEQQAARAKPAAANNLNYYGGQVMLTSTTYAIYWIPPGFTVSSTYQSLLNRYFSDVGGSSFYNIMTQYYQDPNQQHIVNSSGLGGSWVDTRAYPHTGNASNPLTDADIQAEVVHAASVNGWTPSNSKMFLVFTAKGVESCLDSADCTPGTSHPVFCAYHGYFVSSSVSYIYANMPYDETWGTSCRSFRRTPNHDIAADSEISTTSHEHFEAVTDLNPPPLGPIQGTTAWTDSTGYEIGDKCAYNYGSTSGDGHNITMNGHPYIMQLEWSNAVSGCAKSF